MLYGIDKSEKTKSLLSSCDIFGWNAAHECWKKSDTEHIIEHQLAEWLQHNSLSVQHQALPTKVSQEQRIFRWPSGDHRLGS